MDKKEKTLTKSAPPSRWRLIIFVLVCSAIFIVVGPVIFFTQELLQARADVKRSADYVALGSSFAAGPGIGQREFDSFFLCARSEDNYAHEFAASTHFTLLDVTCSGATSDNILSTPQFFLPIQIDAVHNDVKLVTVTVGGNDASYIGYLMASACKNPSVKVPLIDRLLGMCHLPSEHEIEAGLNALPGKLYAIVNEINRRAPTVHVVLVDYATVLPDSGSCAALGLTVEQANRGRAIAEKLRLITAEISRSTGSTLIQSSQLTHGHDACSSDPWVNGFVTNTSPGRWGPAPFHPKQEAMHAISIAMEKFRQSADLSQTKN